MLDTIYHYKKGWGRQVNSIFGKKMQGGGEEIEDGNICPGRNISCKVIYPIVPISVVTNRNFLFQLMDLICDWDHKM